MNRPYYSAQATSLFGIIGASQAVIAIEKNHAPDRNASGSVTAEQCANRHD